VVLKPAAGGRRADWTWIGLKAAAHVLALLPALGLLRGALADIRGTDLFAGIVPGVATLGADPVAAITHGTGDWTLRLLLLCLAMTPLRRLTGKPWPIRFRRLIGLYAFFYACLHFGTYLVLDLGGYWSQIFADIVKRPYITVGFTAWLLLLPLAVTSTRGWIRRLGRRWGQLHKAVYVAGVLGVVHFWWLVKSDVREPLLYATVLAALLGVRLWWWRRRPAPAAQAPPRGA
jgi:sulfoxide reductase heme-binding subunit YedZ